MAGKRRPGGKTMTKRQAAKNAAMRKKGLPPAAAKRIATGKRRKR